MSDLINVQTTVDSKKHAQSLVQAVLEERLAAWGQISGPTNSIYWSDDELDTTDEWTCTFWTSRDMYSKVERMIMDNHPYEEPGIAVLPLLGGNRDFVQWIEDTVEE